MRHSRITALAATAAMAVIVPLGVAAANAGTAHASGTTIETITQSKVMLTANCYETYKREVIWYTHSTTKGWVPEPSPKVETTKSETCDK